VKPGHKTGSNHSYFQHRVVPFTSFKGCQGSSPSFHGTHKNNREFFEAASIYTTLGRNTIQKCAARGKSRPSRPAANGTLRRIHAGRLARTVTPKRPTAEKSPKKSPKTMKNLWMVQEIAKIDTFLFDR
jgi:hypothetical protein